MCGCVARAMGKLFHRKNIFCENCFQISCEIEALFPARFLGKPDFLLGTLYVDSCLVMYPYVLSQVYSCTLMFDRALSHTDTVGHVSDMGGQCPGMWAGMSRHGTG